MRSRADIGENTYSITEQTALSSFMKSTKMIDIEPKQKKNIDTDFEYHPSNNKEYSQKWAPFYKSLN